MDMESARRQAVFSWVTVGSLALLCGTLAVLQYQWIGEVSHAQEDRLRNNPRNPCHIHTVRGAGYRFAP